MIVTYCVEIWDARGTTWEGKEGYEFDLNPSQVKEFEETRDYGPQEDTEIGVVTINGEKVAVLYYQ